MDILFQLPLPFHLSVLALVVFSFIAFRNRYLGWGLPMGVVLATVAVWYQGDALYNDYEEYRKLMGDDALEAGWWQVLLFIGAFGFLVPVIHNWINAKFQGRKSILMVYFETRQLEHPAVQHQIDQLAFAMTGVWVALMTIALVRVDFNFIGLFAPYMGEKAAPWSRGRLGGGIDALLSLAGYLQVFLAAGFGVLAAISRNPTTRTLMVVICFLTFPFFIFDRTRNTMLATMLPGILAFVAFRVRGGLIGKAAALAVAFAIINFWFSFVIANRGDGSIASAIHNEQAVAAADDTKHEGLSMFSELGYMNDYFAKGTYQPNWGVRYLSELANPIPRAIWKNKPMVGVDYAIARGFGVDDGNAMNAGIAASIATGMIGQGVVNFGGILGPIAAATLMALWVALLARQDLLGRDPARLLLYSVGMILTFNMGRDITLLVLYPFLFGMILLMVRDWLNQLYNPPQAAHQREIRTHVHQRNRAASPSIRRRSNLK